MLSEEKSIKLFLPGNERPIEIALNVNDSITFMNFQKIIIESIPVNMPLQKEDIVKIEISNARTPLQLRSYTSDIFTFWQIFINKEYDIPFKTKPNLIIDGGANVGYSAVFFANKFPEAKIIAIEPERTNFEILRKNTDDYQNIELINSGIWNKNTYLKIQDSGVSKDAFMVDEVDSNERGSFKAVTIGEILRKSGFDEIDILKLDIEGAEKEVFYNNYDEWLNKVKILIIELHDRMKKGCSDTFFSAIKQYTFNMTFCGENIVLIKSNIAPIFKVDFTCKFQDGTVYDTFSGGKPLIFVLGDGQIIPSLEQAILKMSQGESKTIRLSANRAFGPYCNDMIYTINREQLPKDLQPEIGQEFQINLANGSTKTTKVTKVSETSITLDANHPLAGKDLVFDIKLIEIT